jgi:single-stranded-DNA-specific exonuclease
LKRLCVMEYILRQKNKLNPQEEVELKALSQELSISLNLARILYGRGVRDAFEGRRFLKPERGQMHDPYLFRDMADSVSTIKNVISRKERICVYGDYDADGTVASAILYLTLKKMGADVECFLPSRMEHGYGLSIESIKKLRGIRLLITVDCGISNVAEIEKAKNYGIHTIITDHHECGRILPAADYILNPKCPGETYPYADLCGAGVAFKLAQALIGNEAEEYIDIAAVATIADIVPLTGENRVIAAFGLEKLNNTPNQGIRMLYEKSGLRRERIDEQTVSFGLAPRINAAGRIATARTAFDLMIETDEKKLEQLSRTLCELNTDRQTKQERVINQAIEMETKGDYLILLYQDDWDVGVVGLAASKVAEQYNRPTILFGKANGFYVGSARSIQGINIYEAIATQADLCEKFGGHAGAAGLTVAPENLDTLKTRLNLYIEERYDADIFLPVRYYDLEIQPACITLDLIGELERLRPYGHKNEAVDFLIRGANLTEVRSIGADRHAKLVLRRGGCSLNAVHFGIQAHTLPKYADVIGTVGMNQFDNQPQMVVGTLSFPETQAFYVEQAESKLGNTWRSVQKEKYFCDREKLLAVYMALKDAACNRTVSFDNMESLITFLKYHVEDLTDERIAFACRVLKEIELLTIRKNDKIYVTIASGKRNLDDSKLYREFKVKEKQNGSQGKNQKCQ